MDRFIISADFIANAFVGVCLSEKKIMRGDMQHDLLRFVSQLEFVALLNSQKRHVLKS